MSRSPLPALVSGEKVSHLRKKAETDDEKKECEQKRFSNLSLLHPRPCSQPIIYVQKQKINYLFNCGKPGACNPNEFVRFLEHENIN